MDWWSHEEYSHGFIIPLIAGYLLWRRRMELRDSLKSSSPLGFIVFSLGLVLYILGSIGEEEFVQRISLPVALLGIVYFLNGRKTAQLCLFPIAYLFFMIPVPYPFYKALSLKLRLLDSMVAASWSSFLGVPVYIEGYFLHLPHITLEVADACSGILSIFALMAIGIFYTYIFPTKVWKKVLMLVFLIPIAILSNVVRIVSIAVLIYYSGDWILHSTFHKFNGTFNFLLGLTALILISNILDCITLRKKSRG